MSSLFDLIVIGGGAAGFFGAIAFAGARPGASILILEKGSAVLGKVRVSGGGRCNVTNVRTDPAELVRFYPRGGPALRGPLTRFGPRETAAWFESEGVRLKAEPDGRMFPTSDRSETIIQALTGAASRMGVQVRLRAPVERIEPSQPDGLRICLRGGELLAARRVLLASGGDRSALDLAAGLGHRIVPPVPSLFSFTITDPRLAGLAGLSVPDARLRLPDAGLTESGPLLITHWGLSGPAALRLSAWGARFLFERQYRAGLRVSWIGAVSMEEVTAHLNGLRQANAARRVASQDPSGRLPQRLWQHLVAAAGIGPEQRWADLSKNQLRALAAELCDGQYQIVGKGEFKDEFVTCGGVSLDEVSFKTMQSRICPGLYLAGEVLDIDGLTGGFNFQSAWTTAWIAGSAAGQADG